MGFKKTSALVLIGLFLISIVSFQSAIVKAQARTLIVPDQYPTIQDAIGNASSGDTVYVKDGTYNTGFNIDKSLSLVGEDPEKTIIRGIERYPYWQYPTIQVSDENVSISGFTITNSWEAIDIYNVNDAYSISITGNNIVKNLSGIGAGGVNLVIFGNNITDNSKGGISFDGQNSIISNNYIYQNSFGIYTSEIKNVTIQDNTISDNGGNSNSEQFGGLDLQSFASIFVHGNNIENNVGDGILLEGNIKASIHNNNITNNTVGIKLDNYLLGGIFHSVGTGNEIYNNNLIDNIKNALVVHTDENDATWNGYIGNGTDVVSWDSGKVGNYWSDYSGQGTYVIDQNNTDEHPLSQQVHISTITPTIPNLLSILNGAIIVVIVVALTAIVALLLYRRHRKTTNSRQLTPH